MTRRSGCFSPTVNNKEAFEKFARLFILTIPKAEEVPIDRMKETQEILLSLLKMA
ncbi:MAG: hypothetical protein HQL29_05080 [Candidatus Omnitrophica bacterium]|nr:hypothetical protein [Candidatus Omnitrophota bacterium]